MPAGIARFATEINWLSELSLFVSCISTHLRSGPITHDGGHKILENNDKERTYQRVSVK
jgi:hypothetical protein